MAFKKYDSSYKRTESPFTIQRPIGSKIDKIRMNKEARERDEKNKEQLLEKAKGRMIKKAERKERKAAKKREYAEGNTSKLGISRKMAEKAAARKTRKATRIRKRASELTADDVVEQRDRMRTSKTNSPYRKEKTTGGKIVEKVKKKAKTKAAVNGATKVTKKVGAKRASKALRLGGRLTGLLGLGTEATVAAHKGKSREYRKMDKRSPGTSKRLETGAYGNQGGVRGTFFSAMKLKEKSKPTQPKKPKSSKKYTKSKEPAIHNRPKRNMGKSKK